VRPDTYLEINNFYTATVYEKGAELVRMMQTLVGGEGFARGMALYFERHDGQAVTCEDFAQAIADANPGSALATRLEAFKRWYSQAGTPRVTAQGRYDAASGTYTLALQQQCAPSPGQMIKDPFVIPLAMGLVARDGTPLPLQLQGEPDAVETSRVLVLDQPSTTLTFVNVGREPVPSLLRGFSAPVLLRDNLSDDDLLTLLAYDEDPFNRWDAGQRLALGRIVQRVRDGSEPTLDDAFIDAMRTVLRHPSLDAAFKELVLTLPSEGYVAEQLDSVDPQRIHAVRESMKLQLAQQLHADWLWAWHEYHHLHGGYSPDPVSSGRRAIANLALAMLVLDAVARGDDVWPGKAYQRFKDASNMTDRIGALSALVDAHAVLAEPALDAFHEMFRTEALVIDKWFTLQARAPEPIGPGAGRVFERVKALTRHPDFSLRNPNRARSLLFAFAMHNPAAFHRTDAAGYVFWADRVLEMDAFNPQLASRLARVMDRWSHLAEPYRSAAREAIGRVAARSELSTDVREIVTRALEP
jgi:aminopeptidase N